MKILLTGISGFVGSHLASHLLACGHEVAGVLRRGGRHSPRLASVRYHTIDDDGTELHAVLQSTAPDLVIHLAAHYVAEHRAADIQSLIRGNVEFGAQLLEAMSASRCAHLVYAGTAWQHHRAPVNLYAAAKNAFVALAAFYRSAHGLRMLELALYDSYGPDDPRPKLINQLKYSAQTSVRLDMTSGTQRIHLLHIDDLCRGLERAGEQVTGFAPGEHRVYRLPSGQPLTLRQLVDAFNAAGTAATQAQVRWGAKPHRAREVMTPWEGAEVLPGWQPQISIEAGMRQLRSAAQGARHDPADERHH
jgi:nucleoside-diphosphate-sugar epimerase